MWISKEKYKMMNDLINNLVDRQIETEVKMLNIVEENKLLKNTIQEYINQHELDQMTIRSMHEIIFDLDKKLIRAEEKNKRKTPFARCPVCSSERPRKEFYNMQKNQIEYSCECGTEWALLGK